MAILNGTLLRLWNGTYTDVYDDALFGTAGDDRIYGLGGNDHLYGNNGNDIIDGGRGADVMSGGEGADTFVFKFGDSTIAAPDTVKDFTHGYTVMLGSPGAIAPPGADHIDAAVAGTASNYQEWSVQGMLNNHGYDSLLQLAASGYMANVNANGAGLKYLFVTDGHDGYLFADLDNDGLADSAMILKGASNVGAFDWHDII